ncbi:TPA: BREX-1 system adenine-specific DNA-methyltransferase PglX [Vibrio alginolyticus]|uniref:BREX-1 system adenine-specific DNA-methyltransferase PglX n=1 Tax=Vibrio alginolyticus TaxID=663 RepID=UPI001BD35AD4|nr:BREX-1 system adenine-specific DNA-methyltransferase PglX [Vibrio alginolyticus]EGQ8448092.1 BREX-1 system adenine-specific DNA-methyltransferase PglX [Vibrio alginolyticus]EJV5950190.1 BREX-1 system adenine-specific DNA-methyltransferase PglX [Vibrio alginolyticus]ELB2853347.1 BREX-1 system adenine-specific DNA-methyltransferase PglX [Vibrio alginolyticus]MBT0011873.1 BREX-1 system adenine-specific DNA-methyltransferase PglX [Vibrio alginolyticus]MBT0039598.1 BREX-1 system adenine-specific
MDTSRLKKFAQFARRSLIEQVQTKLKFVLAEDSLARRESPKAVKELENKKQELGEEQLLEQVAYTWFNRFCALRFMDANQYNRIMVVSPVAGQFQPEILAEAKAGHLDDSIFNEKARDEINGLLSGAIPSRDGQSEAYRLMIVTVCNDYHRLMPYLFERIEDYTELLMPDDLLSGNSILAYTREAMTPENCESVESIGWLYQFYISEKKDQVFEGLKKNKKITPENIPAATQLFTPHWIVRYLVENSLGRLWMLNNPSSKVVEQMDYYIKPVEEEKDYLKVSSPEELKICDPACGSGHMLTYAYDLLYAIYLDAGYDSSEIPEKILTNNLYGIEIDERAAELAAFALSMKALKGNPLDESNNRRRFFRNPIEPNICHIQNVSFSEAELDEYFEFVGVDLFTKDLRATLKEFEEADNFGSLIQPTLKNPADVLAMLDSKDVSGQLFLADTHRSVLRALKQADFLSQKYQVVVANPPYMGAKGMNVRLKSYLSKVYPDSKADLYSMFVERCTLLSVSLGFTSMITMQSWMFLSRFASFRKKVLSTSAISRFLHLGSRAFDSISGEVVQTSAFILENRKDEISAVFTDVTSVAGEKNKSELYLANKITKILQSNVFSKIPGWPITYSMPDEVFALFSEGNFLEEHVFSSSANVTGDNDKYLKFGWEIERKSLTKSAPFKWLPCAKGGEKRKWYGNWEYVIDWSPSAHKYYQSEKVCRYVQEEHWGKRGVTWSRITSADNLSFRLLPKEATFETAGMTLFPNNEKELEIIIGFLNSSIARQIMKWLNPTLTLQMCDVLAVPFVQSMTNENYSLISKSVRRAIEISSNDWNQQETSWDFETSPLLRGKDSSISRAYETYRTSGKELVEELKLLEITINQSFSSFLGVNNDVSDTFGCEDVTLLCNPKFRYNKLLSDEELESEYLRDSITEFISYSLGCMFGRYSADKEGLILADRNATLKDFLEKVPQTKFMPDQDNVIPLINFEGDWFEDDIAERFKSFLKVTFGEELFTENLRFIETNIGKDIKKYFIKDFYADHLKRYKKRPIYWMFSSPKGSFNALIYMHRYNKDTVDVVLNNYLREFRTKLLARKESLEQIEISASASQKDKTQAIKTITKINKVLDEINDYEHDVLYPLAGEKVEIDLDDGVKHNYPLFGKALKKVPGLS